MQPYGFAAKGSALVWAHVTLPEHPAPALEARRNVEACA